MRASIDLYALYQYDETILDELVVPASIDLNNVKDNLVLECAEQELLYTDPQFLRLAIGAWSKKQLPIWQKLAATLNLDYNPIENYNMVERETPAETTETNTPAETTTTTRPAETHLEITPSEVTETNSPAEQTATGNNLDNVYGFNGDIAKPAESGSRTEHNTVNSPGVASRTVQEPEVHVTTTDTPETVKMEADAPETRKLTVDSDRVMTRAGNIGVTTTQQMIVQEREVAEFNLIDRIIKDFKARFVLGVY